MKPAFSSTQIVPTFFLIRRDAARWLMGSSMALLAMIGSVNHGHAADVNDVLRSAEDAATQWKSYTCDFAVDSAAGDKQSKSSGTVSYLKPGYLKMETTTDAPTGKVKTIYVSNGKNTFYETKSQGGPVPIVMKGKVAQKNGNKSAIMESTRTAAPSEMISQYARLFDLKVDESKEEKLSGQEMDILVGDYRKGALEKIVSEKKANSPQSKNDAQLDLKMLERLMGSIKLWIGREDHFLYKVDMNPPPPIEQKDGKTTAMLQMPKTSMVYSNVKFNVDLKLSDFIYVPPDGARIVDVPEN